MKIVQVDRNGVGADGEDYLLMASQEQVDSGHMANVPTLIQYPDGTLATGNRLEITSSGLAWLKRNMPKQGEGV